MYMSEANVITTTLWKHHICMYVSIHPPIQPSSLPAKFLSGQLAACLSSYLVSTYRLSVITSIEQQGRKDNSRLYIPCLFALSAHLLEFFAQLIDQTFILEGSESLLDLPMWSCDSLSLKFREAFTVSILTSPYSHHSCSFSAILLLTIIKPR